MSAPGEEPAHGPDEGRRGGHFVAWVLAVVVLAAALRLLSAGHGVMTVDEPTWLGRTRSFEHVIRDGDFARATSDTGEDRVATRPGITTLWIGTAARGVGHVLVRTGLTDRPLLPAETSTLSLQLSQQMMALVSALMIGAVVLVGRRPLGGGAALLTGLLLAVEPFLVAHNAIFHTDGLLTLAALASFLALLDALRLGRDDDRLGAARLWPAALAGAFAAIAVLTKLNALLLLPGFGIAGITAVVVRLRAPAPTTAPPRGAVDGGSDTSADSELVDVDPSATSAGADGAGTDGWWARVRPVLAVAGVAAGVALACFVVPYPALWADPAAELGRMADTLRLGDSAQIQFFRGEITESPGAAFYPVVLAMRASPWLVVAALAGLVLALAGRLPRLLVGLVAAVPAVYLVESTLAAKKFDRYALPVLAFAAVIGALAVDWTWTRLVATRVANVWARAAVAAVLVVALALPSVVLAPHALAFYDPLVGGGGRAERALLIGWGEGIEAFADRIAADNEGRCDEVVTQVGFYTADLIFPCGRIRSLEVKKPEDLANVDYVILYPLYTQRQIGGPDLERIVKDNGRPVMHLSYGGVDYGTLYEIRH